MKYPHIAARAVNRALLVEPGYARTWFSAMGERMHMSALVDAQGQVVAAADMPAIAGAYGRRSDSGKLYSVQNGVAIVPVEGTLVHKSGYVGSSSGMMGYDGLEAQLKAAMADPTVRGILLDIDSPGGEVAGVQELARIIGASTKPVWSHANEMAASAGYWLASAADRVLLTETAEVGSVGVLMAHADRSGQLASDGIKVTLIYSGARKVDGNPFGPLPDDVRADLQDDLDGLRNTFASSVATHRGLTTDQVLATEARLYRGQAAVDQGLADQVMSFDETLAAFASTLAAPGTFNKGTSMSQSDTTASPLAGEPTQAPNATAQIAAARAEGHAAGLREGAAAERTRIGAILGSDAATGREATAREFALGTDMSAEVATRLLATVPASGAGAAGAAAHAAAQTLAQMSDAQVVQADASSGDGGKAGSTLAQRVAALQAPRRG